MAHVRQQIRDAAVAALTGLPATGGNVFPGRRLAVQEDELPALAVYTGDERLDSATKRPVQLHRLLDLHVECIARNAEDETLDDDLDDMTGEVEAALAGDPTLGGLVKDCALRGIQPVLDAETGTPLGRHRLTFETFYVTAATDPETAL